MKLLGKVEQDEIKEKFILAAFVGFQMGAGGSRTFPEYLVAQGLSDEVPQQAGSRKEENTALLQKREDGALSRMGIKVKKVKK